MSDPAILIGPSNRKSRSGKVLKCMVCVLCVYIYVCEGVSVEDVIRTLDGLNPKSLNAGENLLLMAGESHTQPQQIPEKSRRKKTHQFRVTPRMH